ncbi:MAG: LysE family translocator [Nannocystaceae bacterium]
MNLFLEGLLFGVIPVFFVGPVFFTLLHVSLRQGFVAGAQVAVGIALSDICALAVCVAGMGPILSQSWGQWGLEFVGGLILFGFGVVMTRSAVTIAKPTQKPSGSAFRRIASGFVVNFVNPFVFAFWIGAIGGVTARHGFDTQKILLFFAGVVTTIFVTDVLKARIAGYLKSHLQGKAGMWTQRICGLALGGCGLYLVVRAGARLPALVALQGG